jgi:hypothetical protein
MRTALLQTFGEACTVAYWLRNFATWRDEVDQLIVLVNNLDYPDQQEHARKAFGEVGATVHIFPGRVSHGDCIDRLVSEAHAADPDGLVVLVEDDAYVRHPGAVRAAFDRIERGEVDVIGSPRNEEYISDPVIGPWGPPTKDWVELGRVLWPAFLFARSADLMATNRRFGYDKWQIGQTIAGLDIEVTQELCDYLRTGSEAGLDVFYGASFQLRGMGLRIEHVNHVRPWLPETTKAWVKEDPPWFHVTEVSQFVGAAMPTGPHGTPEDNLADLAPGGGRWNRRVAWWERIGRTPVPIARHAERYRAWLDDLIKRTDVDRAEVARWDRLFDPWVTWDDALEAAA